MRMANGLVVGVCVVGGLMAWARGEDWGQYGHDAQHTGLSGSRLDPASLVKSWASPDGYHDPILAGDRLFAIAGEGTTSTQLTAFDLVDGHVLWSMAGHYENQSSLAYGQGVVAFTGSTYSFLTGTRTTLLHVLDATTGAERYTVQVPGSDGQVTLGSNSATGQQVAYVHDGVGPVTAVRLGDTSGTLLWSSTPLDSPLAAPTAAEGAVIVASAGQYYAIDPSTGTATQFRTGKLTGGFGYHTVVDSVRQEVYIAGAAGLAAYRFAGGAVTPLWETAGVGPNEGSPVTLGPDGSIYAVNGTTLMKLDPADGHVVKSVAGVNTAVSAPLLTRDFLWNFGATGASGIDVYAYRPDDLSLAEHVVLPASQSSPESVVDDTHLVLAFADSRAGFTVYSGAMLPEPETLLLVLPVLVGGMRRRR